MLCQHSILDSETVLLRMVGTCSTSTPNPLDGILPMTISIQKITATPFGPILLNMGEHVTLIRISDYVCGVGVTGGRDGHGRWGIFSRGKNWTIWTEWGFWGIFGTKSPLPLGICPCSPLMGGVLPRRMYPSNKFKVGGVLRPPSKSSWRSEKIRYFLAHNSR